MKCKDCNFCMQNIYEIKGEQVNCGCCMLTRLVVNPEHEHNCSCFNRDLSKYDICYNCKYYQGGGDWGLFCSHKEMYYHLGRFNDKPCEYYEKKEKINNETG